MGRDQRVMKRVVLFLSGPPKAGKSRLRGDLYRKLVESGRGKVLVCPGFLPRC